MSITKNQSERKLFSQSLQTFMDELRAKECKELRDYNQGLKLLLDQIQTNDKTQRVQD